jgi:prevent-host-death family protein
MPRDGHSAHMRTFTATQARRQLVRILEELKPGEVVQITLRGKPVAHLIGLKH